MSIQTKSLHAEIVAEILDGHGLPRPDGRPLHAYMVTDAQFERMARTLRMRVAIGDDRRPTAEIFALWASEKIRRDHRGGPLKWELLFDAIDAAENQALARILTARGLDGFGRDIRRSERGALYLYSLMAEGGLPDALIAEAGRFRDEIVAMVAEIEAEGRTRPEAAAAIVERRLHALPLAFRTEETQELFAEFAAGLIALRAKLPADVDETTLSEELTKLADWRAHLPVRLSTAALRELVGPALLAPLGRRSGPRPALARRQLRRAADGVSWTGALTIADQGILPHERLPEDVRELRLRFLPGEALASCHEAFFGAPEPDGWRLSRIGRRGDAVLPLDPSTPARLCAHADGRHVGDALIDGGLDAPEESPSFWKSVGDGMLEPLGATGVTRGDAVWLLAPPETRPDASEGVVLSGPEPAPGGLLWRLAGDGDVRVGHRVLKLRTAADSDAPSFQLVPVGTPLRGWRDPLGWPVFVGEPRFFGGETDGASRSVAGSTLARNPAKRLFAQAAIWIRNGTEQARSRLIVLPRDCRIRVSALPRGGAAVDLTGLPAGLIASLGAAEPEAGAAIPPSGDLHLRLVPEATAPAHLHLRLYDSRSGRALTLHAPWPGREAVFAAPDGARLERERQIAIGSLPGWRGIYPEGGGVLQIRPEGGGERIAIAGDGEISLSAQESFLRSLLAQLGPDGSLRLRLVAGGVDSPRLVVRRHEWSPKRTGDVLDLGPSRVSLHALPLDGACGPVEREAAGPLDLRDTLGSEPSVWFIQGRCPLRGVMRPVAWSGASHPSTTRDERIAAYVDMFDAMLAAPADPRWRALRDLLSGAGAGGDIAALDQVRALAQRPAAAVALVLRATRKGLADTLSIDDACPIWWPLTQAKAWTAAVACDLARRTRAAIMDDEDPLSEAHSAVARRAHDILALRPELAGHLACAFADNGLPPFRLGPDGIPAPLRVAAPDKVFDDLANELARRAPAAPQGAGGLPRPRQSRAGRFHDDLRPFLDAPLLCAQIALGLREKADPALTLRLMALRIADPLWFDASLPAAMQIARANA